MSEHEHADKHEVTVKVNNKEVSLEGPRVTGAQIKAAAVEQGVSIQQDFQLALVKGKQRQIIGDDEPVTINKNTTFIATAPDDNS